MSRKKKAALQQPPTVSVTVELNGVKQTVIGTTFLEALTNIEPVQLIKTKVIITGTRGTATTDKILVGASFMRRLYLHRLSREIFAERLENLCKLPR